MRLCRLARGPQSIQVAVAPPTQRLSTAYPIDNLWFSPPPLPFTVLLLGLSTQGASLLAIDFAGSGRSDGRWVTLGWWEKDDLATVLEVSDD